MAYREIAPPAALASHVACLWWRDGVASRVLPDGCADLVWTGVDLVVAGPATRPITPRVNPGARKLGVRFRVGAAGAALGVPAAHLLDPAPPASEARPDGRAVVERVADAPD